jgi:hypothetical protein
MARKRRATRRRTLRSPIRRRSKRRTSKRSAKPSSAGSKIYSVVKNASGYLAFASQLTEKDYSNQAGTGISQQPSYKNEDIATKAKVFANVMAGRLTGMTIFKSGNMYDSENTKFTINPNGVVNKWVGVGLAGLLYKNLPIKQLPQKSKIGAVSKRVLLGGLIGGILDPPEGNNSQVMASSVRRNGIVAQNRSATLMTGQYAESADSTGGSF